MPAPIAEYQARLSRHTASHTALERHDARLAGARLVVFGAGAVAAVAAVRGAASWWWLAAPAIVFLILAVRHDRVIRARRRAQTLMQFYDAGIARLEDRWMGAGQAGDEFRDDTHPYAADLDLFGRGSLFQLLSRASSRGGAATLAGWLTDPAPLPEIAARQEAVRELAPLVDLREDLADAGQDVSRRADVPTLLGWASETAVLPSVLRPIAFLITGGVVAALVYGWQTGAFAPALVLLGVQSALALPLERRVRTILHGADGPARSLAALVPTLARLERAEFRAPRLAEAAGRIAAGGARATTAVARLERLIEMHDWQHNLIFSVVALLLMWGTHLAFAVEAWRRAHGAHVRDWVEGVVEFEALSSLGCYAYEHPADPFPQFDETADSRPAEFDATELGHPLLPSATMVRNDVRLTGDTRLLLVSGSNMSGKSTLLRTVGVNAVLAQMGAPVRAASLRLTPLRIGATLRIQDSLQEGRSRFYAEITRVRALAELARGPVPLLFLLDELFHGTNSHDRLAGAAGVLRGLVEHGAIGLVTTHDLALTAIAADIGTAVRNVHFEDQFDGTDMRFDYRMKPGPVTRSNALALMRAVGLDVDTRAH